MLFFYLSLAYIYYIVVYYIILLCAVKRVIHTGAGETFWHGSGFTSVDIYIYVSLIRAATSDSAFSSPATVGTADTEVPAITGGDGRSQGCKYKIYRGCLLRDLVQEGRLR